MEFHAQLSFAPVHSTLVALVIITPQMENPVQGENFDFLGWRVTEGARILRSDGGGNRDVAGEATGPVERGGKREYVGSGVLSAEAPVECLHLGIGGHEDIHPTPQPGGAAGTRNETTERQLGQAGDTLLKDDQFRTILSS